jgi:hypothetical protein
LDSNPTPTTATTPIASPVPAFIIPPPPPPLLLLSPLLSFLIPTCDPIFSFLLSSKMLDDLISYLKASIQKHPTLKSPSECLLQVGVAVLFANICITSPPSSQHKNISSSIVCEPSNISAYLYFTTILSGYKRN